MVKPYLKLTLGAKEVTLDFITGDSFPRVKVERTSSRTQYGVFVRQGFNYPAPHLWNFTAVVLPANKIKLDAIYAEYERLKEAGEDPKILLTDATERFTEASPRTRGKAAAPFDTEISPFTGDVSYFATFWVEFLRPIEYSPDGKFVRAQISLEESDVKTTP